MICPEARIRPGNGLAPRAHNRQSESRGLDLPPGSENVSITLTTTPGREAKAIIETDEGVTTVDFIIEDPDDDQEDDEEEDDR